MLEKVIENWTSRLDYIRASRGSPMPEIIFKMCGPLVPSNPTMLPASQRKLSTPGTRYHEVSIWGKQQDGSKSGKIGRREKGLWTNRCPIYQWGLDFCQKSIGWIHLLHSHPLMGNEWCETFGNYSSHASTVWGQLFIMEQDLRMDRELQTGKNLCEDESQGRSSTSTTEDYVQVIEGIRMENRRVTVDEIIKTLHIS
ncbi:hypothetical protein TNCV_2158591 [Trichonephila clavipes]|nr:hypothetical protein TNCV_2158591 [Trichonephila clavipes]